MKATADSSFSPIIAITPALSDNLYFEAKGLLPPRHKYILEAVAKSECHFDTAKQAHEYLIFVAPTIFSLPVPVPPSGKGEQERGSTALFYKTFAARVSGLNKKKIKLQGKSSAVAFIEEECPTFFFPPDQKFIEYPLHWKLPEGELAEQLKDKLLEMTTNGVDVDSIKIYTATELVNLLENDKVATRGIIPPGSVEIKDTNWALFFNLDGEDVWELDLLVGGKTRRSSIIACEKTKNAVWEFFKMCEEDGICLTKIATRIGPDPDNPETMVAIGFRKSFQKNSHGETYGLHTYDNEIMAEVEALGSAIMSGVTETFVEPFFTGAILMLMKACAEYGGNAFPSMWPFTLQTITSQYSNGAHFDASDLVGAFIVWLHAGEGELQGGEFVVSSHGCHFKPEDGCCLYLRSPKVAHYTVPPKWTGTRCQLGISLASSKNVITGLKNQVSKALKDTAAGYLLAKFSDIPEEFKETPAFKDFLDMGKSSVTCKNKRSKLKVC